jgi:enoyl-CoA hydratase/carnithine racemase
VVRTAQNLKEYVMTGLAFSIQGRIASIVFDRPNEQNLLSRDLLLKLRTIAKDLASDPEIQVLTLTGEGTECFSTGILTPALRGQLAKDQVLNLIRLANETFDAIEALPQIVIAGLNGYVRAGAVELALACDIRIAGNHVRLSSPEAKWGGFPGAGAPVRLPNIVGTARTLEMLCTGREIDATEMKRRSCGNARACRSYRRQRAFGNTRHQAHCEAEGSSRFSRGTRAFRRTPFGA